MILPISFTGTFKVNNKNPQAFSKFQKYAESIDNGNDIQTYLKDEYIKTYNCDWFEKEQTLIVPDEMDGEVRKFCAENKIFCTIYDTGLILSRRKIFERINHSHNKSEVAVDVKKLKKLIKNQKSNIPYYENEYKHSYKNTMSMILRSGEKINLSTLIIRDNTDTPNFPDSLKENGAKSLKDNQISINFDKKLNNLNHYMFFALQDLGYENVPVYVDGITREIGTLLGIF